MSKFLKIALFLFFQVQSILAQEPNWINTENRKNDYPNDKYLTGYFSEINTNSSEQEKVLNIAKKLLIESIQVEIISTSNLLIENIQINDNVETTEHFKQVSESIAEADIVGIQYGTYYDTKTKTAFALAYAEKAQVIQYYNTIVENNFFKIEQNQQIAQENRNSEDYQLGLEHYYACFPLFEETERAQALLLALGKYENNIEEIQRLYRLQNIIQNNILDIFDILLENLEINKTEEEYQYHNNGQGIDLTLQVQNVNNVTVQNIPIKFSYIKDNIEIEKVNTDNNGKATCFIKELDTSQKLILVKAELDILDYLNIKQDQVFLKQLVENYAIPSEKFTIEIQGSTAFIKTEEKILDKDLSIPLLEPKLKASLTEKGFELINELSDANYYIDIIANTRQGNTYQGQHFAYLDVIVSVIAIDTGEEIYKNAYIGIKGGALDYEQASRKAYAKVMDIILEDIIDKIK